jgi:endoglucanase Acf2
MVILYAATVVANFLLGGKEDVSAEYTDRNIANPTDDDETFFAFRMKDWYRRAIRGPAD